MTHEDIIEAARDLGSADRIRGPLEQVSAVPGEDGLSPLRKQAEVQTRQIVYAFANTGGDDTGLLDEAAEAYLGGYQYSTPLRIALG